MKEKMIIGISIVVIAALLRLVPHIPNVTPLAAMAFFGGAYLDRKWALILPLTALFISDLILGFHSTMPFVYGCFILSGCIGYLLRSHRTVPFLALGSLVSSTLFFIITNFGVWLTGTMYEKTLSGLMQSYVMGVPFFRNTLLGDGLYLTLFVSLFAVATVFVGRKAQRSASI